MAEISAKVGDWSKGAINKTSDVQTVQKLLMLASADKHRADFDPGRSDGVLERSGSATLAAILAFQGQFMNNPDGVISPGRKTMDQLSEFEPWYDRIPTPAEILGALSAAAQGVLSSAGSLGGSGGGTGSGGSGPCFPIPFRPKMGWHKAKYSGLWFGAKRRVPRDKSKPLEGYRKHAACDLLAPQGTPVHAVDGGTVLYNSQGFYLGTYEFAVRHDSGFVVRYGEVQPGSELVVKGDKVKRGDLIAKIGRLDMLHLEMYSGTMSGSLSQEKGQPLTMEFDHSTPFQRRADLIDPTSYLDSWKANLPQ